MTVAALELQNIEFSWAQQPKPLFVIAELTLQQGETLFIGGPSGCGKIRMPGFVVPLDAVRNGQREFLLVPYFGACVHTPPPPANQIVLVTPHPKLNLSKTLESMDVIWVEGELKEARTKTASGVSGYTLEAVQIYPYTALHNTKK